MTLKDWVDLLTGGGAAISAIAAGVAAWASRTSAKAAEQSSEASRATLAANERIANNDWRIRLMAERMAVWRAFDDLMITFMRWAKVEREDISSAQKHFQLAVFIFDPEISYYLKVLTVKLLRHSQLNEWANRQVIDRLIEHEPEEVIARKNAEKFELEQWLLKQQQEGKALFMRHMSLID